jgi:ferredoxin-thioredoxin reductase catalytic subunit
MAQSLTAKTISNRIYWAKERGYKDLVEELKTLRNQSAIVLKTPLNATKEVLFEQARGLVQAFEDLGALEKPRRIEVDEDHSIRVILPTKAIVHNSEAVKKLGNPKTDVVLNGWLITKRRDMPGGPIRMIPNGFGNFVSFAEDAIKLSCYFDRPLFTRVVRIGPDKTPHAIAATYTDGDDVVTCKLRAAERGMRIEIEW